VNWSLGYKECQQTLAARVDVVTTQSMASHDRKRRHTGRLRKSLPLV
jgi:hypothetical protein